MRWNHRISPQLTATHLDYILLIFLVTQVHYRATAETNRFTVLLNNMRLMGIFDWWIAVLDFISKSEERPLSEREKREHSNSQEDEAVTGASNASKGKEIKTKIFLQVRELELSKRLINTPACFLWHN